MFRLQEEEVSDWQTELEGFKGTWYCSGWKHYLDNGETYFRHGEVHDQTCVGFQSLGNPPGDDLPVPSWMERVTRWGKHPTLNRWYSVQRFVREIPGVPAYDVSPQPRVLVPGRYMPPVPSFPFPNLAPETQPIQQPVEDPHHLPHRAIPHRRHSPHSVPGHRSEWGYDTPSSAQTPGLQPDTPSKRKPAVEHRPNQPPRYREPEHRQAAPGRRTRERKFIANLNSASVAGQLLSAFTESLDFVDAIWWALPVSIRGKRKKSPVRQAQDLWDHWDHIDLGQAFGNVLANEIQDRAIGFVGSNAARAYTGNRFNRGVMVGPGTGPAL
jgi:hypothetical protein